MAVLSQPAAPAGKKPRARKTVFHPDMTPMVDLAFLLLTFFMLTTTFAKPRALDLHMPVRDARPQTSVKASEALTLILGGAHRVYYYFGLNRPAEAAVPALRTTDSGPHGIRQVLLAARRERPRVVLIKTTAEAKYKDMVDVLDEMSLTEQKKYALVELDAADRELLKNAGH